MCSSTVQAAVAVLISGTNQNQRVCKAQSQFTVIGDLSSSNSETSSPWHSHCMVNLHAGTAPTLLVMSALPISTTGQLTAWVSGLGMNSSTAPAASPTNAPRTAPYA